MPLQNRVTPTGDIVASEHRGTFTGNRGIIHDPATRTLLNKRWSSPAWLTCVCEFRGRRRKVMSRQSWTELFFLDEATAFAAGHRPCFYCRRDDAKRFRAAWESGNGVSDLSAKAMDAVLHAERLDHGRKRLHAPPSSVEELPDGAVIAAGGEAYTIAGGRAFRWTERGYAATPVMPRAEGLLTPPATLGAIRAGYRPVLHPDIHRPPPQSADV